MKPVYSNAQQPLNISMRNYCKFTNLVCLDYQNVSCGLGSCKGRGVRYGVICVNVSLHGSMWKSMYVHRLALLKDPSNLGLQEVLHLQSDASHLCHNTLCINLYHISVEPHWLNNSRQQCRRKGITDDHSRYPRCKLALALPRSTVEHWMANPKWCLLRTEMSEMEQTPLLWQSEVS